MSKHNEDRQFEYDIKYLRKVLSGVDESIKLPHTLSAEAMRPILDTITVENTEPQQHIVWSALSFLRARVFSLQSAVSYALAFVLIVAVAYGMRLGSNVVDGSIVLTSQTPQIAAVHEGEASKAKSAGLDEPAAFAAKDEKAPADNSKTPENTVPAVTEPDTAVVHAESFGVGGGAEAIHLGADEQYIYLYRINDPTDPAKADFPVTVEIVSSEDGQPAGHIDIPEIETINQFYMDTGFIVIVGSADNMVLSFCYDITGLSDGESAGTVFAVAQPGKYENSHLFEGILHTVSFAESEDIDEASVTQLPDAVSDTLCVITAENIYDGSVKQEIYRGADKGVSMHDRSIYISYMAQPEGSTVQELSMAQIRLDGVDFDMIIVP